MTERNAGWMARLALLAVAVAMAASVFWLARDVDLGRFGFLAENGLLSADADRREAADSATTLSRWLGIVHADAADFWARGPQAIPRLSRPVFFCRSVPTPCAGRGGVAGHFYCAADGTTGLDLVFAAEVEQRLREVADAGQALLVGRIVADGADQARAASRTGSVLRGDCLTGVWAASRGEKVAPGLYSRALVAARRAAVALAARGPDAPVTLDGFGEGVPQEREVAFRIGVAAGDVETCAAF